MSNPVAESATNLRFQALQLMLQLQKHSGSLTRLLPEAQERVAVSEQAQLQAWIFGWCRWSHELEGLVGQLLQKPLKPKDQDVYLLMQLGVFQLKYTPTADHAAVDETVKVIKRLKKPWARGVVNAVLRNYQRQSELLHESLSETQRYSHPAWLLEIIRTDWPEQWQTVCLANNEQGPMWLRVNRLQGSLDSYQARLGEQSMEASTLIDVPHALLLEKAVPVSALPGFEQGDVSIQDGAAQMAEQLLGKFVPEGGRLLDACAAPGGKTAHAAESGRYASIVAIDRDEVRLKSVHSTLQRLNLETQVNVVSGDATQPTSWWDNQPFNAILLDAPCSGTGVIRRHPDIKLLRRASDIENLVALQAQLLDALWSTLAPGGVLLYATCSIFKDENERQIERFLQRNSQASLLDQVRQILPGERGMDGFFYAAIKKPHV